ncbi:MAG: four helix bundle protein [bacterium]|nr:four helix bundle protein [bacterium]
MFNFEKLNVYKEALLFVDFVYERTKNWPSSERYILVNQLTRASISIVLNIAEGSGRTSKDFGHFVATSRSSVYECVAILTIALGRKYITKNEFELGYEYCNKLARMLTALKKSLE